ncbi:hypothetical protein [Pajaroellobacter abortibovis]|uniref:hypothetical protein n=1 Tax=Pajaroellobacter abortibovis TaxID=1882918 RepID=UPI0012EC072D|nr:hypothetical protein [Pajaroellobacter abortibovis]
MAPLVLGAGLGGIWWWWAKKSDPINNKEEERVSPQPPSPFATLVDPSQPPVILP